MNRSETQEPAPSLDWTKLPSHLQYLAKPAAQYGSFQFEDRIFKFFRDEMTDAQKVELEEVGLKLESDDAEINQWIDKLGMTSHREAALVYFLGNMIALGNDAGYLYRSGNQQ